MIVCARVMTEGRDGNKTYNPAANKKGMTREQAETMPNMRLSGITKQDPIEISTLGLAVVVLHQ